MATKKLNLTIQLKRGTTEEWEQYGAAVPAVGEPCLDLTTGHLRFGDGETPYKDLKDAAAVVENQIIALQDTDDVLQRNLEFLLETIGDDESGLVKDVADLGNDMTAFRYYVGEIPEEAEAVNVIGYVDDLQAAQTESLQTYVNGSVAALSEAVHTYVDESQLMEHPNKAELDSITQTDINRWNAGERNVIEAIRVNGTPVPVSAKIADITVSQGGGGAPLPDVTTDDDGKFLRVVNGAWAADSLTDVSKEGM